MSGREGGVLWLTSAELSEAIPLAEIVRAVEDSYALLGRGAMSQAPRLALRGTGVRTWLNIMPALSARFASTHVYSAGNRGLPAIQKVTLVFAMEDGALRAVIESDWLSWARTGATGAVATRHLARPEARTLGIIGAGKQARAQLLAIAATRPLASAYVYSPTPERRRAFAEEMSRQAEVEVLALESADRVVERSEIISTATTSREPVFSSTVVHPGLHVNAIGAHAPNRREVDGATVARSRVVVDDPDRSRVEDGEVALAIAESAVAPTHPVVGLADVVAGKVAGRTSADEVTLFLSGGLGSEYLSVAAAVVDRAEALGLGSRVPL